MSEFDKNQPKDSDFNMLSFGYIVMCVASLTTLINVR